LVLKLDKGRQELLFEVQPETFQKCPVGTSHGAMWNWAISTTNELAGLIREAWSTIVPKKVSRPVLEAAKG
jgi:hypothetical protein